MSTVTGASRHPVPRPPLAAVLELVIGGNEALARLDAADYPNLHALRRQLTTTASSEQFEYGLEHLVRSLRPLG
jgi:hypothetical protein